MQKKCVTEHNWKSRGHDAQNPLTVLIYDLEIYCHIGNCSVLKEANLVCVYADYSRVMEFPLIFECILLNLHFIASKEKYS